MDEDRKLKGAVREALKADALSVDTAEDKYVYFLLGIAAAAIAFAIQRTIGYKPQVDWADAFLVGAFALWAGSFIAGCRNRHHRLSLFRHNHRHKLLALELIDMKNDESIPQDKFLSHTRGLTADFKAGETAGNRNALRWYNVQFWLLVAGGVSFFVWHAAQVVRQPAPQPPAVIESKQG